MIRPILFVSFANYLDDANGASVASRALMEALVRRGFPVEVVCGPVMELGREIDLPSALGAGGLAFDLHGGDVCGAAACGAGPVTPRHLCLDLKGIPITILAGSTLPRTLTTRSAGPSCGCSSRSGRGSSPTCSLPTAAVG